MDIEIHLSYLQIIAILGFIVIVLRLMHQTGAYTASNFFKAKLFDLKQIEIQSISVMVYFAMHPSINRSHQDHIKILEASLRAAGWGSDLFDISDFRQMMVNFGYRHLIVEKKDSPEIP